MDEAFERRDRSHAILRERGIAINSHLPLIEVAAEAARRSCEEVADRVLALLLAAARGQGMDKGALDRAIGQLAPRFSTREQAFLNEAVPAEHEKTQFIWGYEAAWALLWSLSYVETLAWPAASCDADAAVLPIRNGRAEFLAGAAMRPIGDILDAADLVYRQHWSTRNASFTGQALPAGLDNDVIVERHRALNWLVRNEDWDEITTDT